MLKKAVEQDYDVSVQWFSSYCSEAVSLSSKNFFKIG